MPSRAGDGQELQVNPPPGVAGLMTGLSWGRVNYLVHGAAKAIVDVAGHCASNRLTGWRRIWRAGPIAAGRV
jgi:hypothetical protein